MSSILASPEWSGSTAGSGSTWRAATSSRSPTACSRSASASGPPPAGAERLARTVFGLGLAHTVLAVPIDQDRATMHLDTICTMVDVDAMVMYPNVAHRLIGHRGPAGQRIRAGRGSASRALPGRRCDGHGDRELRLIDTGLDPVTAEREQWDDGNNTLASRRRSPSRTSATMETNDRLGDAGIEVIPIAGSELGSGRGGPRCMSCPIGRDPLGG